MRSGMEVEKQSQVDQVGISQGASTEAEVSVCGAENELLLF